MDFPPLYSPSLSQAQPVEMVLQTEVIIMQKRSRGRNHHIYTAKYSFLFTSKLSRVLVVNVMVMGNLLIETELGSALFDVHGTIFNSLVFTSFHFTKLLEMRLLSIIPPDTY